MRALSWETEIYGQVLLFNLANLIGHLVGIVGALAPAEHVPELRGGLGHHHVAALGEWLDQDGAVRVDVRISLLE